MLNSNEGKKEHIDIGENRYLRLPVKTRVIVEGDSIPDLAVEYAGEYVKKVTSSLFRRSALPALRVGQYPWLILSQDHWLSFKAVLSTSHPMASDFQFQRPWRWLCVRLV